MKILDLRGDKCRKIIQGMEKIPHPLNELDKKIYRHECDQVHDFSIRNWKLASTNSADDKS